MAYAPASAEPFASDWAKSSKSSARLVVADPTRAGVEIRLAPGAITYWRDPGDAGVPPSFDFSGSANLKTAEVAFPAPKRIVEPDGSVAYGYDSDLLFPVRLTPIDPAEPTRLALAMTYAVCEKICLPARATVSAVTAPGVATPFSAAVDAADARVPKPIDARSVQFAQGASAGQTRVCIDRPLGAAAALFLEGPEGWRAAATPAAAPSGGACFDVRVVEKPAGLKGAPDVRLTFAGDNAAFETRVDFVDKG